MHRLIMNCTFLLLVGMNVAGSLACSPVMNARKIPAYKGKKLDQPLMWTRVNLSVAYCVEACYEEQYCLSFHYDYVKSECMALRERFEGTTVSSTDVAGYELFQTGKPLSVPGSDCEVEVDCSSSLSNSYCFVNACRCLQGYQMDGDICRDLTECSTFGVNFTMYEQSVILGNDISATGGMTRQTCQQKCSDNTACRSADFDFISNICYIQSVIWTEVGTAGFDTSTIFDFYQRQCSAW